MLQWYLLPVPVYDYQVSQMIFFIAPLSLNFQGYGHYRNVTIIIYIIDCCWEKMQIVYDNTN